VVRTDAAAIWATGEFWWQIPRTIQVILEGSLPEGSTGKDVILLLCGLYNEGEVLNAVVEFTGPGVAALPIDARLSISNMTTEWGALAGVFPLDEILREFLYGRAEYLARRKTPRYSRTDVDRWFDERLEPDDGAAYAMELTLDLATVIPHVSGPDHVKVMHALGAIEKRRIKINKAYLLSCVNARLEDLAEAAGILQGRKVAQGVEFYVAAASAQVQEEAQQLGHWQTLIDAGAIVLPSGCGPCIGLGRGTLEPGEVCISSTNRNFKGRMGSREAQAYLGSPAIVAASAAAGYICAPQQFDETEPRFSITVHERPDRMAESSEIIDGFPTSITGRALLLPVDNLNTDGIYSSKLTYRDDVTPAEMAAAAMANYDPTFNDIAKQGDIIVAGRNFGTGSSREQAATCLAARGLQCVIAASFSQTYKRNAFNNGFLVLESVSLYDGLRGRCGDGNQPTVPGPTITIDFAASQIEVEGKSFAFSPLSKVAQELIVAGGAENLVKQRLG
ncbi:MAG: homoaconitase, partial [Planctomycetes bacterium]|nr:homoaconitase [Planctomycetota bacterium]